MDNYTLTLIKNNGTNYDITSMCGNLSWKDSVDTLGVEVSFEVARNTEDKYMSGNDVVAIGDKIVLMNNNKELVRGIIADLGTERYRKSVTAFDYAFYLNQSKIIIQFNKVRGNEAIRQVCKKFNIQIGNITNIPTVINQIYKDTTVAEIIKDILDQSTKELGIKYRLEMRQDKLYIEKYSDLVITPIFKPAENIPAFNMMDVIGSISKSESIQEMRNSIIITSGDEKSTRVVAEVKDSNSISNFGLLQEVESVDKKDIAKAMNIAKNKLKELNKVGETISIGNLLGDDNVRSGRTLIVNNDMFGLSGGYLVKDCTHTYQNRTHRMSLSIEKVI